MKIPTRPAPSVPQGEPALENSNQFNKPVGQVKPKKKPPPRPPPPKFNNKKFDFTTCLIDLSAPLEYYLHAANTNENLLKPLSNDDYFQLKARASTNDEFFKPMSSGSNDDFKPKSNGNVDIFKSKSTNNDFFKRKPPSSLMNNNKAVAVGNSSFFGNGIHHLDLATGTSSSNISETAGPKTNIVAPTIIRAQPKAKKDFCGFQANDVSRTDLDTNNYSPPMPTIPPPGPPNYIYDNHASLNNSLPHGVALYSYIASHKDDLPLQAGDVVILLREINEEWYYGRVRNKEGMFPANFIDIRVSLSDVNHNFVTALYEFNAETCEDLKLMPGQKIKVLKRISQDWLYGESNGYFGQFPSNFVDHIPANI